MFGRRKKSWVYKSLFKSFKMFKSFKSFRTQKAKVMVLENESLTVGRSVCYPSYSISL
jgi:hypothetical protein